MSLLQALICEPGKARATMCLAAGEPSDLGRVKDSAWTNERRESGGVGEEPMVSLNAWEPVTLCQC